MQKPFNFAPVSKSCLVSSFSSTTKGISTISHKIASSSSALFASQSRGTFADSFTECPLSSLQAPSRTVIQTATTTQTLSEHCFHIIYICMIYTCSYVVLVILQSFVKFVVTFSTGEEPSLAIEVLYTITIIPGMIVFVSLLLVCVICCCILWSKQRRKWHIRSYCKEFKDVKYVLSLYHKCIALHHHFPTGIGMMLE